MKNHNGSKRTKEPKQENNRGETNNGNKESGQHIHSIGKAKQALLLMYYETSENWSQGTDTGNSGEKEQPAAGAIVLALYGNSKGAFTT